MDENLCMFIHCLKFHKIIHDTTTNTHQQVLATRSQAVARIADRTASQHLLGSRDIIGHVTIR